MNPLNKGTGKGTGEKAGATGPGMSNPGKGGGGPGQGFAPWMQRQGAPAAPRIGALGDDPTAWQIGYDGRVITMSPEQPPMPPQSWTSPIVSPPGSHPPQQWSPTTPAAANWGVSAGGGTEIAQLGALGRHPRMARLGVNSVVRIAPQRAPVSGPKFFGDLGDDEEFPTPEASRVMDAGSPRRDVSAQTASARSRKRPSKARRQKMRSVTWTELEAELQKIEEVDECEEAGEDTARTGGSQRTVAQLSEGAAAASTPVGPSPEPTPPKPSEIPRRGRRTFGPRTCVDECCTIIPLNKMETLSRGEAIIPLNKMETLSPDQSPCLQRAPFRVNKLESTRSSPCLQRAPFRVNKMESTQEVRPRPASCPQRTRRRVPTTSCGR